MKEGGDKIFLQVIKEEGIVTALDGKQQQKQISTRNVAPQSGILQGEIERGLKFVCGALTSGHTCKPQLAFVKTF